MEWGIGLLKAIANGSALEYIQETIVKPFVDALMAFVNWIKDVIVSSLNILLQPTIDFIARTLRGYAISFVKAVDSSFRELQNTGHTTPQKIEAMKQAIFNPIFYSIVGLGAILSAIGLLLTPFSAFSFLIGFAATAMVTLFLTSMSFSAEGGSPKGLNPPNSLGEMISYSIDWMDPPGGLTIWDWLSIILPQVLLILSACFGDKSGTIFIILGSALAFDSAMMYLVINSMKDWSFDQNLTKKAVGALGALSLLGVLLNIAGILWRAFVVKANRPLMILNIFGIAFGMIGAYNCYSYIESH